MQKEAPNTLWFENYLSEQYFLWTCEIGLFTFFWACERAESSKSCNLIGSESGQFFTGPLRFITSHSFRARLCHAKNEAPEEEAVLPANPGGIVGSFIHTASLFVVSNEQNWWFRIIFLLKLALLLALAREKWILLFRQNIWRENRVSQPGKPLK